jgi:uncharacterized membrane protein YkvA (DUF1232 family)
MPDQRPVRFEPEWRRVWNYLRNPKTDWKPKALVVFAVLYLIWPLDLLPDIAPILGWLDDIGVGTIATLYLVGASRKQLSGDNEKPRS